MLTQLVSLPDTAAAELTAECTKLPDTAAKRAISKHANRHYQFAKLPGTFTGLPGIETSFVEADPTTATYAALRLHRDHCHHRPADP